MFQSEGLSVLSCVVKPWTAVSSPCLWNGSEGKRHKRHLPLLQVIYWSRSKQSVTKRRQHIILFIGDKMRENSHFDSVLKVSQSYLLATPYSSLFLDLYQLLQIQPSDQCHLSVKFFKKAEYSWPMGLNSSLNPPTDGNFPGQSKKPSLPNKQIRNLEILLCSTVGAAQGRRLLFATSHSLEMKEEVWKKSAQQCFGQCCVKWHHQ